MPPAQGRSPLQAGTLARRLLDLEPSDLSEGMGLAAVALLVRLAPEPQVLLMRRAVRAGDRWSGQVSLPGGKAEPEDEDLLATAIRETHEELGLRLDEIARPLGRLATLQARARRKRLPLHVVPYVFEERRQAEPRLGPEAARAFWLPLEEVRSGALDAPYTYTPEGSEEGPDHGLRFPSWSWDGETVWGMTHHILGGLLEAAYPGQGHGARSSGPLEDDES